MSSSAPIQLSSPGFTHGSLIPVQHTCDGDDVSPPLKRLERCSRGAPQPGADLR